MKSISRVRVWELIIKTTLGYFVFVVAFVSVPYARGIWHDTNGFENFLKDKHHAVIGQAEIILEIADDPDERAQGLSGRQSLKDGNALFFVFDNSARHAIWMKDMLFPIDIIWFAENMKVIHMEKDVSPSSYPKKFQPTRNARFVLEVPAGFIEKEGIKIGDLLVLL